MVIQRWVTSHGSYSTYAERILPLLSRDQRKKHKAFAQRLLNNQYLGNSKYLLVHFDEKWFWGLVLRKSAKACKEIGLDPHVFRAYHKLHIEKVMGVAVTGYAYENNVENGGVGLKLGLYRAEAAMVAKKQQRQATKDEDGKVRYDGDIVREKGDIYFKDCTVTGSDPGTSSEPKFPLKKLFAKHVFPLLERLVGPRERFQGYTVIIQGDQAGPHEEEDFMKYCRANCAKRGWCFEPQAPQAPHLNNLDLAVFPAMSRRHSIIARNKGLRVLKEQEIWDAAMQVWDELPSCKIAQGFVQVYRLAQKVMKANGGNGFLRSKGKEGLHCGVAGDFIDTPDGIKRRDGKKFTAASADAVKHSRRSHVNQASKAWKFPLPKVVY